MIEDKNIPHVLNQTRPSLSAEEKVSLWSSVEMSIPPAQPILSPYSFITIFKQKYIMAPIALFLAVILGGGATVYASDTAKPGDFLFPIDRLVENVQLDLTFSEEGKSTLVDKFTKERLDEIYEIINEEAYVSASNVDASSASSTDNTSVGATLEDLEVTVDVFTDTTVVKLEIAGKKFYFETIETEQQKVVAEIVSRFPVLTEILTNATQRSGFLTFQVAGRASLPNDRGIVEVTPEGQKRIAGAVDALLTFLDDTSSDDEIKDTLISAISQEVDALTQAIEITRNGDEFTLSSGDNTLQIVLEDNGDNMLEIKSDTSRIIISDIGDELDRVEELLEFIDEGNDDDRYDDDDGHYSDEYDEYNRYYDDDHHDDNYQYDDDNRRNNDEYEEDSHDYNDEDDDDDTEEDEYDDDDDHHNDKDEYEEDED